MKTQLILVSLSMAVTISANAETLNVVDPVDDEALEIPMSKEANVTSSVERYIVTPRPLEHMCFVDEGKYRCMQSGTAVVSDVTTHTEVGSADVSLKIDRCIVPAIAFQYRADEAIFVLWQSAKIAINGHAMKGVFTKSKDLMKGLAEEKTTLEKGQSVKGHVIDADEMQSSELAGAKACWSLRTQTIEFTVDVQAADKITQVKSTIRLNVDKLTKEETVVYLPKPKVLNRPLIEVSRDIGPPERNLLPSMIVGSVCAGIGGIFGGCLVAAATNAPTGAELPIMGITGLVSGALGAGLSASTLGAPNEAAVSEYREEVKRLDYLKRYKESQRLVALWEKKIGPNFIAAKQIAPLKKKVVDVVVAKKRRVIQPTPSRDLRDLSVNY